MITAKEAKILSEERNNTIFDHVYSHIELMAFNGNFTAQYSLKTGELPYVRKFMDELRGRGFEVERHSGSNTEREWGEGRRHEMAGDKWDFLTISWKNA